MRSADVIADSAGVATHARRTGQVDRRAVCPAGARGIIGRTRVADIHQPARAALQQRGQQVAVGILATKQLDNVVGDRQYWAVLHQLGEVLRQLCLCRGSSEHRTKRGVRALSGYLGSRTNSGGLSFLESQPAAARGVCTMFGGTAISTSTSSMSRWPLVCSSISVSCQGIRAACLPLAVIASWRARTNSSLLGPDFGTASSPREHAPDARWGYEQHRAR